MDRNKSYISKNSLNERPSDFSSVASQELVDIQNGVKKPKQTALDLKNQNTSNEGDAPFKNVDPSGIFQQCVDQDGREDQVPQDKEWDNNRISESHELPNPTEITWANPDLRVTFKKAKVKKDGFTKHENLYRMRNSVLDRCYKRDLKGLLPNPDIRRPSLIDPNGSPLPRTNPKFSQTDKRNVNDFVEEIKGLDVIVEEEACDPSQQRDESKDKLFELGIHEELLFHYLSILALIPYKWDNLKTIIERAYEPYTID